MEARLGSFVLTPVDVMALPAVNQHLANLLSVRHNWRIDRTFNQSPID